MNAYRGWHGKTAVECEAESARYLKLADKAESDAVWEFLMRSADRWASRSIELRDKDDEFNNNREGF